MKKNSSPEPEVMSFALEDLLAGAPDSDQILGATMANGANLESRKVYVVGEVDPMMFFRVAATLDVLDETEGEIEIVLMSHGGEEQSGYAIYDAIRGCKNPVTVKAFGCAYSMAAIILQAGDKRLVAPNCRFMIHNGSVHVGSGIPAELVISLGKETSHGIARYAKTLSDRSKVALPKVLEMCRSEAYLSAPEMVKAGFADGIIKKKTPTRKKK